VAPLQLGRIDMIVKGIIVTYNPKIERLDKNIFSALMQIDQLVVVDNGSSNSDIIKQHCNDFGISFIGLGKNFGIAAALNVGIESFNQDFDWILTLDQDSIIPKNMINEIMSNTSLVRSAGILCPLIIDSRVENAENVDQGQEYTSVERCIQSGSLYSNQILSHIGLFNEALFIDYVDFEYCYRAKLFGYEILRCNKVVIDQEFGELYRSRYSDLWLHLFNLTKIKIFEKMILRPVINPHRMYYRMRNRIYCFKFLSRKDRIFSFCRTPLLLTKILFRSQRKILTAKMLFRGIFDGIKSLKSGL
jgi:rhamnosyltransferase